MPARSKGSAVKAYNKYFGSVNELRELDFAVIDDYFAQEDSLDDKIAELAKLSHVAKKDKDADEVKRLKAEIKKYSDERKKVRNLSKAEMDKHAQFNRAAKPYVDAKNMMRLKQELKLKKRLKNLKMSASVRNLKLNLQSVKLQEKRNNFKLGISFDIVGATIGRLFIFIKYAIL